MKYIVSIATSYDIEAEDENEADDMAWTNLTDDLDQYQKGLLKLGDIFGSSVDKEEE